MTKEEPYAIFVKLDAFRADLLDLRGAFPGRLLPTPPRISLRSCPQDLDPYLRGALQRLLDYAALVSSVSARA